MSTAGIPGPGPARRAAIVAEWVTKAEADWDLAGREFAFSGSRNLDAIGMLLQQAVEKLMKAVLIDRGVKAPKVHDLELLDRLLGTARVGPCGSPSDLAKLSAAAVESRYPGAWVTTQDAVDLMRIATSIWTMLRPLV